MDEEVEFRCTHCGAVSSIEIDPMGGRDQDYVEDCQVCCRPNRVHVRVNPENLGFDVSITYES